jgi:dolichyl-phosphate-mannose-protein mannosyltransferase
LAFLLGIYLIWICTVILQLLGRQNLGLQQDREQLPLQKLSQINIFSLLLNLGFIPAIIYRLLWIPHLKINPKTGFIELHQQLLGFHQGLANGPSVHPYCSNWYSWPLLLRPISYFYETARNINEPIPSLGPPLPGDTAKIVYDVHALGNPPLWWLSSLAILLLLAELIARFWLWVKNAKSQPEPNLVQLLHAPKMSILLFLLFNYAANLLPWIKVSRCTFIYLYMGGAIFAFLALGWLVDQWVSSIYPELKVIGFTVIFLVILALLYWLPVYLGLPLSPDGFRLRMWFRSWY